MDTRNNIPLEPDFYIDRPPICPYLIISRVWLANIVACLDGDNTASKEVRSVTAELKSCLGGTLPNEIEFGIPDSPIPEQNK